jgi:hypothetical protein
VQGPAQPQPQQQAGQQPQQQRNPRQPINLRPGQGRGHFLPAVTKQVRAQRVAGLLEKQLQRGLQQQPQRANAGKGPPAPAWPQHPQQRPQQQQQQRQAAQQHPQPLPQRDAEQFQRYHLLLPGQCRAGPCRQQRQAQLCAKQHQQRAQQPVTLPRFIPLGLRGRQHRLTSGDTARPRHAARSHRRHHRHNQCPDGTPTAGADNASRTGPGRHCCRAPRCRNGRDRCCGRC